MIYDLEGPYVQHVQAYFCICLRLSLAMRTKVSVPQNPPEQTTINRCKISEYVNL